MNYELKSYVKNIPLIIRSKNIISNIFKKNINFLPKDLNTNNYVYYINNTLVYIALYQNSFSIVYNNNKLTYYLIKNNNFSLHYKNFNNKKPIFKLYNKIYYLNKIYLYMKHDISINIFFYFIDNKYDYLYNKLLLLLF